MRCEWESSKIGDLGKIITGKTPPTKNQDLWDGNIPFITPRDLQNGKTVLCTERTITSNGIKVMQSVKLPPKSVCVSCIGNIGYVAMTYSECISNQQINSIIVNSNNDADFVYYLMKSLHSTFKNYEGQSTTLSILNKKHFSDIDICIPPLDIQKKIAAILSALDEKIAINRAINDNLLEQMQAIYKSWFVDYLPFGGVMPESWTKTGIYSLANIIYGAPFASKQFNTEGNGKPIIRIRDLKDQQFATYTTEVHPKGYLLRPGDIVVGMDGEFRPYIWGNDEAWLNQRVCVFENKRPKGKAFLYFTIKPLLYEIEQTQVATTVIHIGKKDYDAFEIMLPDAATLDSFDSLTAPMIMRVVSNSFENKRLAVMRDALLPKLMSGEIDVSKIDL